MRRFLALLVAFALSLCCVCAGAETQVETAQASQFDGWRMTNDISIDLNALHSLLDRMLIPNNMARWKAERTAILMNAFEPSFCIAENGIELDVNLNGKDALSLGATLIDNGVAIASSLFPSYVITIPTYKINEIASGLSTMFMPQKPDSGTVSDEATAPAEAPSPDGVEAPVEVAGPSEAEDSSVLEATVSQMSPGKAQEVSSVLISIPLIEQLTRCLETEGLETGEFSVNGTVYDAKQTFNASPEGIADAWDSMIGWIFENKGVASILEIAKNAGYDITADQVKAFLPRGGLPQLTVTAYSQSASGDNYITVTVDSLDGTKMYADVRIQVTANETTTFVQLPTKEIEADLVIRRMDSFQADLDVRGKNPLLHGTFIDESNALRIQLSLPSAHSDASLVLSRTTDGANGWFDANINGSYYGANYELKPYDISGKGLVFTASVSFEDRRNPLYQETFIFQPYGDLALDYSSDKKTVLPIAELATEARAHLPGFTLDLLINGLGGLFKTINTAVPELKQLPPPKASDNPTDTVEKSGSDEKQGK